MKKISTIVLFVFMLTWVYFGLTAGSEAADRPVLQEGDRWEFKASTKEPIVKSSATLNGLYELVYHGGQLEVFEVTGSEKTPIGGDGADELKRMILPDEREYLKFPLAAGNKWTGTHTQRGGGGMTRRSMTYTVTGIDGGRYKIEGSALVPGPSQSVPQERNFFYSPSDKAIVKYYFDTWVGGPSAKIDIEIIKFTPSAK
jgi:hypothetical protein